MKKSPRLAPVILLAASLAAMPAFLPAQRATITTQPDPVSKTELVVEGTIIKEDENFIIMQTDKYGEMRFQKMKLKTIQRGPKVEDLSAYGESIGTGVFANLGGPSAGTVPAATPAAAAPSSDSVAITDIFNAPPGGPPTTPAAAPGGDIFSQPVAPAPGGASAGGGLLPSGRRRGFDGVGVPVGAAGAAPAAPATGAGGGSIFDQPLPGSAPAPAPENIFDAPPPPRGPQSMAPAPDNPFAVADAAPSAPSPRAEQPAASAPAPSGPPLHGGAGEGAVVQTAARTMDPAPAAASAAVPKFVPRAKIPSVQKGFDAVVFGVGEGTPIEVRRESAADWARTTDDAQLRTGNEVRTGETKTSRLLLREKKDDVRLPEQTHIVISKLSPDSEEVVIDLMQGSIWSEVSPRSSPDAFQVRTPELTAGVRGTNFRVDRMSGASRVSVFDGVVHVTSARTGVFVSLTKGQAAVVNLEGQILDLIATPVDEQKIAEDWNQWAAEATFGTGSLAAGFTPVGSLAQTIADDNAKWQTMMEEHARNVAEMRYLDKLDEYAKAFERFAADTGHIPDTAEGWSMLKFDTGLAGWNGPYVEGPIPPLDPFKNPLIYRKVTTASGRIIGRVYSMWQDGRDQGGTNSSVDKISQILYYNLDRFRNDPAVNPPQQP